MKKLVLLLGFLISRSAIVFAQSSTILPNSIDVSGVMNNDYGFAIRGVLDNASPNNNSSAIIGQNKRTSSGGVGVWGIHDGYGWGVLGQSKGGIGVLAFAEDGMAFSAHSKDGKVARFESFTYNNPNNTIEIYNGGTGSALDIILGNSNNTNKGVSIKHSGSTGAIGLDVATNGISIWARTKSGVGVLGQTGAENSTGIAGKFENINAGNSNNALEAYTNGTGAAAYFKNFNGDGLGSSLIVGKALGYKSPFTTDSHVDFEVRHPIEVVNGMSGMRILNTGPNLSNWTLYTANATGDLVLYADGVIKGSFDSGTGAYTAISDKRLKTNIKDYNTTLADVMKMEVKSYQRFNSNKTEIGLMAQDALKYFPEIVYDNTNDKGEQFYTMDYSRIGVIAIKAVQEQQNLIDKHELTIQQQQKRLDQQQQNIDVQQKQWQQQEETIKMLLSRLNALEKTVGKLQKSAN